MRSTDRAPEKPASWQVVEPKINAYLYQWGAGRTTAEGEFLPVRSEQLELDNIQGQLLLPLTLEHTIDERSPLCGHTFDSLMVCAGSAENSRACHDVCSTVVMVHIWNERIGRTWWAVYVYSAVCIPSSCAPQW